MGMLLFGIVVGVVVGVCAVTYAILWWLEKNFRL